LDLRERIIGKGLYIPRPASGVQNNSILRSRSDDTPLDHIDSIRAALVCQRNPGHFHVGSTRWLSRPAPGQQNTATGKTDNAAEKDLFYGKIPEY